MRRRRLHFAAPLVIVTTASCGQPAPVQAPPPVTIEGMDHVRNAALAPRDAGVMPIDAAPALLSTTGSPLVVTIVVPEHTEQPKGYISCHDFGPGNRGCNPPRPRHHPEERHTRRVLALEPRDEEVVITFDIDDGDPIEEGMPVHARIRSDLSRTRVGHVDHVGNVDARLVVTLSEAEVRAGAPIDIQAGAATAATMVTGRILDIQAVDASTIITVDAGRRDGVDRGWRLELLDAGGRPVKGGDAIVVKVSERTSHAKLKLTPDQVRQHRRVRLTPRRAP